MVARRISPRLSDIIEACENIGAVLDGVSMAEFERDWQKRWLIERGTEIISEASRHLPKEIKDRRSEIPWSKVAGIGNILRHDYQRIAPDVLWKLVQEDLPILESVCREELAAALRRESEG